MSSPFNLDYEPPKLSPTQLQVFAKLENQLLTAAWKWGEWYRLFGNEWAYPNSDWNRAAPTFFGMVYQSVMNDVLATIFRLFDPPSTMGKNNCSFAWLAETLDPKSDVATAFNHDLSLLQEQIKKIKPWRDKILSHNQHPGHSVKIKPLILEEIDEILCDSSDLLNLLKQYGSPRTYWGMYVPSGVDDLKHALTSFVQNRDEKAERLLAKTKKQKKSDPLLTLQPTEVTVAR